ncbi:MAG: ACT domain-containing protein [Ruminococcaceae bacterium]|nr:ACT domain-containing protein [Oscillospiraceae bacterium]
MIIKQISIFVENKHGRLADITEILARNNINILALSIADTTNFGILRVIVDNPEHAENVLKEAGLTVSITSVLAVTIDDTPGGLAGCLRLLADNSIPVEYAYAFVSQTANKACVILRIEKDFKALTVLQEAGYTGLEVQ